MLGSAVGRASSGRHRMAHLAMRHLPSYKPTNAAACHASHPTLPACSLAPTPVRPATSL